MIVVPILKMEKLKLKIIKSHTYSHRDHSEKVYNLGLS